MNLNKAQIIEAIKKRVSGFECVFCPMTSA